MCRSVGGGLQGLVGCLVPQGEARPDHLHVAPSTSNADVVIQRLEVAADAMARVVPKKENQQGRWLARDAKSRQILGDHGGERRCKSARKLWANMPKVSRQQATFYTDPSVVYVGGMPAAQPPHRQASP